MNELHTRGSVRIPCEADTRRITGLIVEAGCRLAASPRDGDASWHFMCKLKVSNVAKVEVWRVDSNGMSTEVVLKYPVAQDNRFMGEVEAVQALRRAGAVYADGLLVPEVCYVGSDKVPRESLRAVLVTPYYRWPTLWQWLHSESGQDLPKLCDVLFYTGKALRTLHGLSLPQGKGPATQRAEEVANELVTWRRSHATIVEWALLRYCLARVGRERLSELVRELSHLGTAFIHGDCYAYQILVADDHTVLLTDWDKAKDGIGFRDVAQLIGSLSVAFLNVERRARRAIIPSMVAAMERGYGIAFSRSLAYQILELRALARFTPLTSIHFTVVPRMANPTRSHYTVRAVMGSRYYKGLAAYYPFLLSKMRALRVGMPM